MRLSLGTKLPLDPGRWIERLISSDKADRLGGPVSVTPKAVKNRKE